MSRLEVITLPTRVDEPEIDLEPLYRILIHNDDVTPFDYVIRTLCTIFFQSSEMAEHIAYVAHTTGVAVVLIRPRPEAERLIKIAHGKARADGFPLTFSMEPDE